MARPGELASTPRRRFHTEVVLYTGLSVLLVVSGVIYGVFSEEAAGTVLLILVGGFAGIVAGYLALQDRLERTAARAATADAPAPEDDQFLPHASIWPFEMGVGMATAFTGMVLGWAFLVPGLVLLTHSVIGWIAQSRRRSNR
jgi:Cytochrome c oxidase subunit IV